MLVEKIGITKDFKNSVDEYFKNSDNEKGRINSWVSIMNYLQFHIHEPQECRVRIIKSKTGYPLIIIKRGIDKLMIPIMNDRIIKLKLSDFKKVGVEQSILELFTEFRGIIFKVFNDEYFNSRPKVYRSKVQ